MRACWQDTMQWVVAAQKGPSTFCLAGFLPPELHCSDTRPAFKRTLDQLGPHRAPDDIRFTEWHCRYVFADLQAAQGHFLNRLGLKPGTAQAVEIRRYVAQHAVTTTAGVEVGCAKRSAVLSWHAH
jgi:hypothetical protein